MEASYFIKGRTFSASDSNLQAALAQVHGTPERPRCLCVKGGIDMYVARAGAYLIKRMPGSGREHHPSCEAYEPDYGQSGLGMLMGEAVIEHGAAEIELKIGFTFSHKMPHSPVSEAAPATPAADVKAGKQRMSLRSLVHFLFERAGLNRWYPAMAGKRSQATLHKYLSEVAGEILIRNVRLSERLLVPEAFSQARQAEYAERRRAKLSRLYAGQAGEDQKMALVIGEFKSCELCHGGRKIMVRHMPELPLFILDKTWKRIEKVYGPALSACDALGADGKARVRIIICAMVYARKEFTFQIDTAFMMLTTANWIPIEGVHEIALIETLTTQQRKFVKPLRYEAPYGAQFANALMLDTGLAPTALHVLSPFLGARERAAKERVLAELPDAWCWNSADPMPPLPPAAAQ